MNTTIEKYRWEYGNLFEYSPEHGAYVFVASGNGKNESETIAEYEEWKQHN